MILQPHQQATLDFFTKSPHRGIFLLHATGTGKTLTAISIAEQLKNYREVLVLAPKSLHDNFRKELKRVRAKEGRYKFVSSNASNMIDKIETSQDEITGVNVKSLQLDRKLVIVDEAHNVLVGMSNGSKNASALYDMLMKAKNCKIILLTASGIINNIFEAVLALNICRGPIRTSEGAWTTLLPESEEEFERYFVDPKTSKLKNVNKLRNRIGGLVSYSGDLYDREVLSFYPMLHATIEKENYPTRLPIKIVPVPMSPGQYNAYEQARERERMETRSAIVRGSGAEERIVLNEIRGAGLQQSSSFGSSTSYRVRSRQLSNVYAPEGVDINAEIGKYAPKIKSIGDKLKPGLKTIIYSGFVKAGINAMASYLEHLGYKRFDPSSGATDTSDAIHGYYGVYSGEVSPEDRTKTLQKYNEKNSALSILLISSSGAEGLSTKGTRVVHIIESYWNYERLIQVAARAIRYKSHEHLPEDERNVQIYVYLAIPPKGTKTTEDTTDVHLFKQAAKKYEMNSEMLRLMASVSIECPLFNKALNFDCYQCSPRDGAPLYLNDINADMKYPLPCKNDSAPLNAREIKLGDELYYVTDDERVFVRGDAEYTEIVDADVKEYILNSIS